MMLPLTETRPFIVKKSNKQGWRVWTYRGKFITKNLVVKYKYGVKKSQFNTQLEANEWGNNYTFNHTTSPTIIQ